MSRSIVIYEIIEDGQALGHMEWREDPLREEDTFEAMFAIHVLGPDPDSTPNTAATAAPRHYKVLNIHKPPESDIPSQLIVAEISP